MSSTLDMDLALRGARSGTRNRLGYVTDPMKELPLFHAEGVGGWSFCSLANIEHCQPMPVGHLMWFARPCKKCWLYARPVDVEVDVPSPVACPNCGETGILSADQESFSCHHCDYTEDRS